MCKRTIIVNKKNSKYMKKIKKEIIIMPGDIFEINIIDEIKAHQKLIQKIEEEAKWGTRYIEIIKHYFNNNNNKNEVKNGK